MILYQCLWMWLQLMLKIVLFLFSKKHLFFNYLATGKTEGKKKKTFFFLFWSHDFSTCFYCIFPVSFEGEEAVSVVLIFLCLSLCIYLNMINFWISSFFFLILFYLVAFSFQEMIQLNVHVMIWKLSMLWSQYGLSFYSCVACFDI